MLSYLQCIKLIYLSVIGRGNENSVFMDRNRFRDAKHTAYILICIIALDFFLFLEMLARYIKKIRFSPASVLSLFLHWCYSKRERQYILHKAK